MLTFIGILWKPLHLTWLDYHLFFMKIISIIWSIEVNSVLNLKILLVLHFYNVLFLSSFFIKQIFSFKISIIFLIIKMWQFLNHWLTVIFINYITLTWHKIIFWFWFFVGIKGLWILNFEYLYLLLAWHNWFKLFLTVLVNWRTFFGKLILSWVISFFIRFL